MQAEWDAERARMKEDLEWNAMRHQAFRDAAAAQKMQAFFEEAGLDANGNLYVRTLGWVNSEGVLPLDDHQCPNCTQQFDTERSLNLHIKIHSRAQRC